MDAHIVRVKHSWNNWWIKAMIVEWGGGLVKVQQKIFHAYSGYNDHVVENVEIERHVAIKSYHTVWCRLIWYVDQFQV